MNFPFEIVFRWTSGCLAAGVLGWLAYRFVRDYLDRPRYTRKDVVYEEWFASGYSPAHFWTRIGGATHCLRVVVTFDYLLISLWFPFSFFGPVYDLGHVIPLVRARFAPHRHPFGLIGMRSIDISYTDRTGKQREFVLRPRDFDAFADAINFTAQFEAT